MQSPVSSPTSQRPPSFLPIYRKDNTKPWIVPFFSSLAPDNRRAILLFPGGGYGHLSPHEGEGYAAFLNLLGIHAFVVHSRVAPDGARHPDMIRDAAWAMRFVRANAAAWGLDPAQIGVMGSSAGGHLAASLVVQLSEGDDVEIEPELAGISTRPDLGILAYPVISGGDYRHEGSYRNLLGDAATQRDRDALSLELLVNAACPPCFLWHTWEDASVPAENSLVFATALRRHGVPCELLLFEKGPHGVGMKIRHPWMDALIYWLRGHGWVA